LCNELDRSAVMDMVGDFLAEFPARLEEIHQLHAAGKWPDLERAAHSLKGLATLFGFAPLAERFLAIEDAAEVADVNRIKAAVTGLNEPANAAAGQLRGWLENARRQPGT